jgi:hypothetical protein
LLRHYSIIDSELRVWRNKESNKISQRHTEPLKVPEKLTFTFQFIRACFPDTSESFNTKSFGGTLPRVMGSTEVLVDCPEQLMPCDGPAMTSMSMLSAL